MRNTSHYSKGQQPLHLWKWAHMAAPQVRAFLDGAQPVFIYRGMSGIVTATALSIAWSVMYDETPFMVYTRKPEEDSHGNEVEHNFHGANYQDTDLGTVMLVFCDDFVSGGCTRRKTFEAVQRKLSNSDFEATVRPNYVQALSGDRVRSDTPDFTGEVTLRALDQDFSPLFTWRLEGTEHPEPEHDISY